MARHDDVAVTIGSPWPAACVTWESPPPFFMVYFSDLFPKGLLRQMTRVCFHRRDDCQDGTVRSTSDAHNVPGLCLIWFVPRITDPKNDVVVGSEGDVAEPSLNVRVHALDK